MLTRWKLNHDFYRMCLWYYPFWAMWSAFAQEGDFGGEGAGDTGHGVDGRGNYFLKIAENGLPLSRVFRRTQGAGFSRHHRSLVGVTAPLSLLSPYEDGDFFPTIADPPIKSQDLTSSGRRGKRILTRPAAGVVWNSGKKTIARRRRFRVRRAR